MVIFYDLVFILFGIFYLPMLLFKGRAHKGFFQRMGFFPSALRKNLESKKNIWIHAVSVGETQAISSLLGHLRSIYPSERIVISTVTLAGNKLARSFVKGDELVIFFPLDLSFIVNKFVKIIKPRVFITAETEIWPNLFLALKKSNVPVILVNGRISQRSFKGYKFAKLFLGRILDSVKLFCAQTELDAARIRGLGVAAEKVVVTGNLKFDVKAKNPRFHLSALGFKNTDLLLVAGSTHEGEEEIIIKMYKNLFKDLPNLKLLIAPRHIERCEAVEKVLDREKIDHARFSHVIKERWEVPVITLDTIGDLSSLYGLADVVFMGGSLVKKGGHNIIEPAMFGKAIVFGQFMFNFKDIAEMFLAGNAAIKINSQEELEKTIRKLLLDESLRAKIGQLARKIVEENKGAADKTAAIIKQNLSNA